MGARLATNVVVPGPEGSPIVLLKGDEVPDWATGEVGDHCLEQGDDEDDEPDADGPPPKSGRGSSAEAWAAYAEANDVSVDEGSDRGEIIAACEAAGVPTE